MNRKILIIETAKKVIVENGLHDASIAKIAKAAKIPVGSVYTYFESKEALINFIYFDFKNKMGRVIFEETPQNLSEKEELEIYWNRAITFSLQHIEDFLFAEQLVHSTIIQKETQETVEQNFAKVFELIHRAKEQKKIKNLDHFLIHHLIYTQINAAIKFIHLQNPTDFSVLQKVLFESCWDSIKS